MKSATTTARSTSVDRAVLAELALVTIDEARNAVTIARQLDRKLYSAVNAVLEAIGGKWNRKAKAHLFDASPREAIETVIATGQVVTHKDLGWFPTPAPLAEQLVARAGVRAGHAVLEPSAGEGAIALAARAKGASVTCIELHEGRALRLRSLSLNVYQHDFLTMTPVQRADRIVMNPPFSPGRADLAHVEHALRFLADGGVLVAVMSAGVLFRDDARTRAFRAMVDAAGGSIEPLPDGSFEASGTAVNTCVVEVAR